MAFDLSMNTRVHVNQGAELRTIANICAEYADFGILHQKMKFHTFCTI
jgi:hypothetical protein